MRALLILLGVSLFLGLIATGIVAVASMNDNPRRSVPEELATGQLEAEQEAARALGFVGFRVEERVVPRGQPGYASGYEPSLRIRMRRDRCLVATVVVHGFLAHPSLRLETQERGEDGIPDRLADATCQDLACTLVWCAPRPMGVTVTAMANHLDREPGSIDPVNVAESNSGGRFRFSYAFATRRRIGGLHAAHRGTLTEAGIVGMPEWDAREEDPPPEGSTE